MPDSLGIVVPAFNEAPTIVDAVNTLVSTRWGMQFEVVVVNDGSRDDTAALLASSGFDPSLVKVIDLPMRSGRGAAIRQAATVVAGSIIAFYDADMEYSASDVQRLLGFISHGDADAVFGSRYLGPGRAVSPYWWSFGQRIVTLSSNAFTDLNLTDVTTSCLVVRREIWDRLELQADGFDVDVEIVAALARAGARIWEVPVEYAARRQIDGRKSRRRDFGRRLVRVFRSRLRGNRLLRGVDG